MACKCGSENQKAFPADVKIYFDPHRTAAALAFSLEIIVCMDCGVSEFRISGGLGRTAGVSKSFRGVRVTLISALLPRQC